MLAIEERFKYVGTAEKYLDAAKAAMNFINTRKRTDEEGIYWTLADAAAGKPSYYDEICMYAGASGIICFFCLCMKIRRMRHIWMRRKKRAVIWNTVGERDAN